MSKRTTPPKPRPAPPDPLELAINARIARRRVEARETAALERDIAEQQARLDAAANAEIDAEDIAEQREHEVEW